MNKVVIIILLISGALNISAQDNHLEIANGKEYDKNYVIPFLDSLHQLNDYVLVFQISSPWPRHTTRCILTKRNNVICIFESNRVHYLKEINLPEDTVKILWKAYVDNDILQIKNEKDLKDRCDKNRYQVEDGHSFDFTLLTKNKMKKLSYYMPEHFEKYCPTIERQKVVACASILIRILMRK